MKKVLNIQTLCHVHFALFFVLTLNEQSVRKHKKSWHYRPPNYEDKSESLSKKKGMFPTEITKAMLEDAEFKRLHEQRKKTKKRAFPTIIGKTPPLPGG